MLDTGPGFLQRIFRVHECSQCKLEFPPFVLLHDQLWASLVKDTKTCLCLRCIEEKLGRPVRFSDLKTCNVTREMLIGVMLAQREGLVIQDLDQVYNLKYDSDESLMSLFVPHQEPSVVVGT